MMHAIRQIEPLLRFAQARKDYDRYALFGQLAHLISAIGPELQDDCEGLIVDFLAKLGGRIADSACSEGVERLGAMPELPDSIRLWLILSAPGHVPAKIISGGVAIPAGEIEQAAAWRRSPGPRMECMGRIPVDSRYFAALNDLIAFPRFFRSRAD